MKKKSIIVLFIVLMIMPIISVNAVSCGNIEKIPSKIPQLTSMVINVIQVAVPIVLVIVASLDLFKAITAQKEDEIKKMQQILIKRIVVSVIIFFVIAIVKFLVSAVSDSNDKEGIISCIDCFLSNKCEKENVSIKSAKKQTK